MSPPVIATWFVCDQAGQDSAFPQMGLASSGLPFQRFYWQCIELFFRTARLHNPTSRLILYCNQADHPLWLNIRDILVELEVRTVICVFTTRPPLGFTASFGNQLYICDILGHIAAAAQPDEVYLVLDSDCLIMKSLDGLFSEVRQRTLLVLELPLRPNEIINGLTEAELTQLGRECGWVSNPPRVKYYGGEFFAATGIVCQQLAPMLKAMLQVNLDRWHEGKSSIKEEAHLLSLAYRRLGIELHPANGYIRRIWTTFSWNDVCADDLNLALWHLPAEKRMGLHRLWLVLQANPALLSQKHEQGVLTRWLGEYLGIPRRTFRKTLQDLLFKVRQKLGVLIGWLVRTRD